LAEAEQRTEQQIKVRQVTEVQASWTERGRGEPGSFTIQLILDNGAEEYVILPTAEDSEVLMELLEKTETLYFDLERQVLMFGNISTEP
jgi:hypothetical protein